MEVLKFTTVSVASSTELETATLELDDDNSIDVKSSSRVLIKGKYLFSGSKKFYVKGVTYGAFQPNAYGIEYHDRDKIDRDFREMAAHGINTVRIPHTTPPRYLLDIAYRHKLKVMVGLSAEQYVGYLIDKRKKIDIKKIIKDKLINCIGHPALLCIAIGNEIPADIVRWIGRRRIENYLRKIFLTVKEEDPDAIVTYVNYPTTEYLQLPFLDMLCFNVYLENKVNLQAYLARLQNIANDRPLILSEVGLDSLRNGKEGQAEILDWQITTTFKAGSAGLIVFSWTDEWFRGGEEVHDWAFGLTEKDRTPKPALTRVQNVFLKNPFDTKETGPLITVVVCTYNGQRTIRECLEGVLKLEYRNYEVIVVNDGSTDSTASIIEEFPFKVITTRQVGLSEARNLGAQAARGEIIAYLDDDAFPDPHWLSYLGEAFKNSDFVAIGGPNLLPENSNLIAACVDHTPGTPTHVLLSDTEAEHIPGCNMAVRKEHLTILDGFDTQFHTAGDDVDLCWRIQEAGWKIGFCPAAVVWHHRRNTVRGFWKQQVGYGKAEALLERKWPKKYNLFGHRTWGGVIYGKCTPPATWPGNWRIYYGIWGSAPFQSIYGPTNGNPLSIALMPEWYILSAALFVLSMIGLFLKPLLLLIPFTVIVIAMPISYIFSTIYKFDFPKRYCWTGLYRFKFKVTTILLHILQPLARLRGRLSYNLTPWRRFSKIRYGPFYKKYVSVWCENWIEPVRRLEQLEHDIRQKNTYVSRGGIFDHWDLSLKGGVFGGVRIQMAAEDHAGGKQYLRFRVIPHWSSISKYILFILSIFTIISILDKAWYSTGIFVMTSALFVLRIFSDCAIASGCTLESIRDHEKHDG